jgi:hypothetical protein
MPSPFPGWSYISKIGAVSDMPTARAPHFKE